MITIDDFTKVEIKVGTILEVEEVEGSEKLYKLKVNFSEPQARQVLSGIKPWYTPEDLVQKQALFVTNLEPRTIMGIESQAMILAVGEDKPILIIPATNIPSGAKIR